MKIVCYETQEWEAAYLKQKLSGFELDFHPGTKVEPDPGAEIVCNFVGSPLDAETKHFGAPMRGRRACWCMIWLPTGV